MAQVKLRKRLGDFLVEENVISQDHLDTALGSQKSTGRKLSNT